MADFERPIPKAGVDRRQHRLQRLGLPDSYYHWLTGDLAHFSALAWVLFAFIMGIGAVGMFVGGTWIWDDKLPIKFISAAAIPDASTPGSRVMTYYRVDVVRGRDDCILDIERAWRDSHGNVWPSTTVHLKYAKGPVDIGLTMVIPVDAWEGVSDIENAIVYSCNPLQKLFPRHEAMTPLTVVVQR